MSQINLLVLFFLLINDPIPTVQMSVGKGEIGTVEEETCFGCGDCSIYCAIEGEYSLQSSSHLEAQANNQYEVKQLDDYNLQTAWIEGNSNYGIEEWIEFKFDKMDFSATKLAINGLYLFNGYRKSLKHWEENSRIKKLKMIVNGQDYAILDLADTYQIQTGNFKEIKLNKDTTIRFEIMETYPGTMYKDVALSELRFKGIHHH